MITWGLVSAATSLVVGPTSFYFMRALLGAAEAGFFPGIAFYLATWFPAEYRTRITAWFMVAIPISAVVGGPLSGLLLSMDGIAGLAGWQWLFIIEGLPAAVVGLSLLWLMSDSPENTAWLSEEEKRIVRNRLQAEQRPREVKKFSKAVVDARVLILGGIQFGFLVGSYGILNFMPQILDTSGQLSDVQIGFVTSGCFLVASVGMILWAGYVDRGHSRITNLTVACAVSGVGFLGTVAFANNLWVSVFWMAVAVTGINGARFIFWTIPPRFLTGVAAAGGLAFINSIGTSGGFVGPTIMGWLTDLTGSFSAGLLAMSGFLFTSAILAWSLHRFAAGD
jgi:MFS family permease